MGIIQRMGFLLVIVFFLALFVGCARMKSVVATHNVTSPVMVGPVANIKGKKIADMNMGKQIADFDIEAVSFEGEGLQSGETGGGYNYVVRGEGSNKFDVELLKAAPDPQDKIVVRKIRIGSRGAALVEKVWTGIVGDIYK